MIILYESDWIRFHSWYGLVKPKPRNYWDTDHKLFNNKIRESSGTMSKLTDAGINNKEGCF